MRSFFLTFGWSREKELMDHVRDVLLRGNSQLTRDEHEHQLRFPGKDSKHGRGGASKGVPQPAPNRTVAQNSTNFYETLGCFIDQRLDQTGSKSSREDLYDCWSSRRIRDHER